MPNRLLPMQITLPIRLAWLLLVWLPASMQGQDFLEGLWTGTLTSFADGEATKIPFELYLEVDEGDHLSGRTSIRLDSANHLTMEVKGYIYADRSIYLSEINFLGPDPEMKPTIFRKFQLVWFRSIWEKRLEGYWQEIPKKDPLLKTRKLGRLVLQKGKSGKA